jgi:RNA polymerase sigma factor (sigma-70 family)
MGKYDPPKAFEPLSDELWLHIDNLKPRLEKAFREIDDNVLASFCDAHIEHRLFTLASREFLLELISSDSSGLAFPMWLRPHWSVLRRLLINASFTEAKRRFESNNRREGRAVLWFLRNFNEYSARTNVARVIAKRLRDVMTDPIDGRAEAQSMVICRLLKKLADEPYDSVRGGILSGRLQLIAESTRREVFDKLQRRYRKSKVNVSLPSEEFLPPAKQQHYRDLDLQRLISKLPDKQREVIDLKLEGYKPAEIAERLGITRQSVADRSNLANRSLRQSMQSKSQ